MLIFCVSVTCTLEALCALSSKVILAYNQCLCATW